MNAANADLHCHSVVSDGTLTPEQLAKLQQVADEKARAEAQAIEAARQAQDAIPQQSPLEVPEQ